MKSNESPNTKECERAKQSNRDARAKIPAISKADLIKTKL